MFLYIMQAGENGPVKVGITRSIGARLASTQTHNHEEVRLLHLFEGDAKEEATIHARFAHAHIRGEWFHPSRLLVSGDIGLPRVVDYVLGSRSSERSVAQNLPDALTHREIIDALGGPVAVQRALGIAPRTNCHWWRRGIPSRFWTQLTAIPRTDGGGFVSIEMLASAAKKQPISGEAFDAAVADAA